MTELQRPGRTDETDWRWSKSDLDAYRDGNYRQLAPEDIYVGSVAVATLAAYARHRRLFSALPFGTLIAAGAVPRGAAAIAPLIKPLELGGYIDVSDREPSNVEVTRTMMSRLALGDLGIWTPHQNDYADTHIGWTNSFQLAGQLSEGHIHTEDMRDLQANTHHIIAVEHGPESATEDEDEYQEFIYSICRALLPGGILYMAYMRGSEGYEVGGKAKPALPIEVDYVSKTLHANDMHILMNGGTDPSGAIREESDEHVYTGLGVAVAVKRD